MTPDALALLETLSAITAAQWTLILGALMLLSAGVSVLVELVKRSVRMHPRWPADSEAEALTLRLVAVVSGVALVLAMAIPLGVPWPVGVAAGVLAGGLSESAYRLVVKRITAMASKVGR